MFSKFLPLLVVTSVLALALGLLAYRPTPVAAQTDLPFKLFNPVPETGAPVSFTLFNVGESGKTQTATQGNSPAASSTLRISQIYTRGGEAGATYQNDFIEIFNASSSNVDINGWSLVVVTFEGSTQQARGATFNQSFAITPGQHFIFRFAGNGSNGQATPGEFPIITDTGLGSTSGQIMLLGPGQGLPSGCPAGTNAVADFVGYGTSECAEGSPLPVPPSNKSLTRLNNGCTDTDNNVNDFALLDPNPRTLSTSATPCGAQPTPTPNGSPTPQSGSQINFSAPRYDVNEGAGKVTITITRSGDVSTTATVDGATANGTASAGSDYTGAAGTLSFAPGETQKNIDIAILDDSVAESDETIFLTLSHPTGNATLGATSSSTIFIHDNDSSTTPSGNGLRISQVYTRGGEAGATYQNDFVEVFNAGSTTVDINGWSMVVDTFEGSTNQSVGATFSQSYAVPPGMHLLFRFNGNGSNGQVTPGEFPVTNLGLGSTSGQIYLLAPGQGLPSGCPAGTNSVVDFVGYGSTQCSEGSPAPVPPSNKSLTRINGGCTDTNNNLNDFALLDPNPRITTSTLTPCGSQPNPSPTPTVSPTPSASPTPTASPAPVPTALLISQIYTRGGEAGATYQNDFIEIFNASSSAVDIKSWQLIVNTFEGSTNQAIGATFDQSFAIAPGTHLLFRFAGNGSNGQPTPGEFPIATNISLGSTSGQIMLLAPGQTAPGGCPAPNTVADLVGYGVGACAEGPSPLPPPPSNKSLLRINGGCTDTNNNLNDFVGSDPTPRTFSSPLTPCGGTPPNAASNFKFSASQFDAVENAGKATVTVMRTGDTSSAATVDYSTADGTASERSDYTTASGTLRFAAGETQKTFDVLITDDGFAESTETVNLSLGGATGNATVGTPGTAQLLIADDDSSTSNNIDNSSKFVEQHYKDFLNRVPDAAGLSFWTNNIESCGNDLQCRLAKRVDTSAAFFLSIEFQKTGFLVYRLYKASLPAGTQRPRGFPRYREFVRDSQDIGRGVVVGNPGYEQLLEANTVDFINRFVTRSEFLANYPTSLTSDQYVDKLVAQSGIAITSAQRDFLIQGLNNGSETRATVLRRVVENPPFIAAETSRAFVLMQYFGYLRRNPDDSPNSDFSGYDFWLNKLNQFNGDYRAAEMVKAFITSSEYRVRFGPDIGTPPQ